ncbi:MAG: serine protease [Treponema sp.]|nr:serine protease [Treponema sp.]
MFRRVFSVMILTFSAGAFCFGQTPGALRDYVGLINQTFHPDIVSYLGKFRDEFDKRGNKDAARSIDAYLRGGSGTGFIYVAPDGSNYIITNHHVITQAYDISVAFEKLDGTKIKYEGLEIIAADEDMDIALLSFPKGGKPFTSGLAFLDRPVNEGEDVYSAGFPGLGATPLWQFGRGMVSNARAEFPEDDTDEKSRIMGPYIQHTAQIDPGNSGGPLLVQVQGVPAGYAVAGINTLSARFRQAANFSIPTDRVNAFLTTALGPKPADERPRLDARLDAFIDGLNVNRAVYEHIAAYLSNACTAENAEYALTEMLRNANRTVQGNIVQAFIYSPVNGMGYAVAWTIENALRSKSGKISISVDTVVPNNKNGYTVTFKVNGGTLSSEWINEYGIWRISAFGDFAAGDKTLVEKREQADKDSERLKTDYDLQISAGLALPLEAGAAFGADFKLRLGVLGYGLRLYTAGQNFFQIEAATGIYIPVRIKKIGLTPYGDMGFGIVSAPKPEKTSSDTSLLYEDEDDNLPDFAFDLSIQGGLMFTTTAVPGLYLQAAYQYNLYLFSMKEANPNVLFFSIGYGF